MIYLFCGDDSKNKHINYEKFLKSIPNDMEKFFIGKNDFNPTQTESFYSGSGLFSDKLFSSPSFSASSSFVEEIFKRS